MLHEAGVVNKEDFERKKQRILNDIAEAERNASHAELLEAKAKKHGLSAADVRELVEEEEHAVDEEERSRQRLVSDVDAPFM